MAVAGPAALIADCTWMMISSRTVPLAPFASPVVVVVPSHPSHPSSAQLPVDLDVVVQLVADAQGKRSLQRPWSVQLIVVVVQAQLQIASFSKKMIVKS